MKWLLSVAILWYWWRVYSLSFNPDQFPNRTYAHSVWDRRADRSFFLGAAIVTGFLYVVGAIHSWWVIALSFAASLLVVMFLQPTLVGAVILTRAGITMLKIKTGLELRSPFLAPFAWTYYLTKEDRKQALADLRAGKGLPS